MSPANDCESGKRLIIANQTIHIPLHLPFIPFNRFKEPHDLSKSVARQRKNTYGRPAAVASSRLFKIP